MRIFSNDPAAFLVAEHPIEAWEEMLAMEEKAVFRDVMAILASHDPGSERLAQEVLLSLDFEFTKIVQRLHYLPSAMQLERINQRLRDYELFLGDCIFKMHSQLNEFSPQVRRKPVEEGSLEDARSLEEHHRLKGFEEKLMTKMANLAQQIRKLSACFVDLQVRAQRQRPWWKRFLYALTGRFFRSGLALNHDLMARLDEMQHGLVQDYARLGTLWRYYNQHKSLRELDLEMQGVVLDFCRKAYWTDHDGPWSRHTLCAYSDDVVLALRCYEEQLIQRESYLSQSGLNTLRRGLELQLDEFQLEIQDLIITLGKYRDKYQELFDQPFPCGSCEEIEQVRHRLNALSLRIQRHRSWVHPILSDQSREQKEAVRHFVQSLDSWRQGDEDPTVSVKAILDRHLEKIEPYLDALVDAVHSLRRQLPQSEDRREGLGQRMRDKYEAYHREMRDVRELLRSARKLYIRQARCHERTPAAHERGFHDGTVAHIDHLRDRVQRAAASLRSKY